MAFPPNIMIHLLLGQGSIFGGILFCYIGYARMRSASITNMKFIEGFKSTEYSVAEEMSTSRSVKVRGTCLKSEASRVCQARNLHGRKFTALPTSNFKCCFQDLQDGCELVNAIVCNRC